jgi:hypothetical protein
VYCHRALTKQVRATGDFRWHFGSLDMCVSCAL